MAVCTHTFLDLINLAGYRAGNFKGKIDTLANPDLATINLIACANEAIQAMFKIKGNPHTNSQASITTSAPYSDGTVATTQGSPVVTGTTTVWTSTNAPAGAAFGVAGYNDIMRISSVQSNTSLTLEKPWPYAAVSGEAYTIAVDDYELPGDFFDFYNTSVSLGGPNARRLDVITPSDMEMQRYSLRLVPLQVGRPGLVTVYGKSSNGNWQARVDPFPDDAYVLNFLYRRVQGWLQNDNDPLPIPDEHYGVLLRGVVANWRETTGVEGAAGGFQAWINSDLANYSVFDQRTTDEAPRIVPADTMRGQRTMPTSILGG